MGYTSTREVFERVIEALSFDLSAGPLPYGRDVVNDGLEPLEHEVENVERFDGLTFDAVNDFVGAGGRGANVFVGIGTPQGGPPFDTAGNPMNLIMPLEIVLVQIFGGQDTFTDDPFLLDDLMDDILRCFHPRRRRPTKFGVQETNLQTVGKLENEPDWYARAMTFITRRDIRNLTS